MADVRSASEVQQRIASAVRSVDDLAALQLGDAIVAEINRLSIRSDVLATLAAACVHDVIWDALAQVRQVHLLRATTGGTKA